MLDLAAGGLSCDVEPMQKKLLFWPPRLGTNVSRTPLRSRSGMPLLVASTGAAIMRELDVVSRNPGNMIHVEAPARMFASDRKNSCSASLQAIALDDDGQETARSFRYSRLFDGVCMSFANIIRGYKDVDETTGDEMGEGWEKLARFIEQVDVPIYVFGVGLQDELAPERAAIPPALFTLLETMNRKARLFGARGELTEQWLHSVGLKNAVALGCPSFYLYPRNVMAVRSPELSAYSRVGSGGRLNGHKAKARAGVMDALARTFRCDYVFQNDFVRVLSASEAAEVYDDATGLLDHTFVRDRTQVLLGSSPPFDAYYLFRDPRSWRMYAHAREAYVGDRLHGGVVFLQTGRPALILQADARVREMTAYYDVPTLAVNDLRDVDMLKSVQRAMSPEAMGRFKETYQRRLRTFVEICEGAGLSFADRPAIDAALGRAPAAAAE